MLNEKAAEQKTIVPGHVSTCVKPGWISDGTSFVETETGISKANCVFLTFTWWFLCVNLTGAYGRRCDMRDSRWR